MAYQFKDLYLFQILRERRLRESTGKIIADALLPLTDESSGLLNAIRTRFPKFSDEDFQHSWRILKELESILEPTALNTLTSVEIFTLSLTALFHDLDQFQTKPEPTLEKIRKNSLKKCQDFLTDFLNQTFPENAAVGPQFFTALTFLLEAQYLSWEALASHTIFRQTERLLAEPLRLNLLAILLRIGDLLDLNPERRCTVLSKRNFRLWAEIPEAIRPTLRPENIRPICNRKKIEIILQVFNKEAHIYWSEWFGYLRQDILYANTRIFTGEQKIFQLPTPNLQIEKSAQAQYEIWPLRFELDETGRIWNIISQAIYTSEYDFLREMIQNAIDANSFKIYDHPDAQVPAISPRSWKLVDYDPQVMLLYIENEKFLEIKDNGIGMDENALQYFLFKIAQTGYEQIEKKRDFQFPSIAKFGIGFISILLRAEKVIIQTKSVKNQAQGRKITLHTEARNAYSEFCDCPPGTTIQLFLKDKYVASDVFAYLKDHYRYPSTPLFFLDWNKLHDLLQLARGLKIRTPKILAALLTTRTFSQSEVNRQEYQEVIQRLATAVKSALQIEGKEARDKAFPFDQLCLQIDSPEFLKDFPTTPYLIYLDNQFDIYESSLKRYKIAKIMFN
ncbi:ATP-binding protein [candidate division KSB1 bacterium]|nr:ATP-binding protein [candidate division KSB1 bacterium]